MLEVVAKSETRTKRQNLPPSSLAVLQVLSITKKNKQATTGA